ncbi:MAG: V-type ATPase subunit [Spirochaetales bacterium]|jgi:V/A-type H+-transporting ATPase subunit C|nr:V-type ATPase subunit [Exilispira sp.]NMC67981.1 V-type ATPase subunit [Spirochaetales bacterium]
MLSNIRLKDNSDYIYLSSVIKSKEKQLLSDGDFIEMLEQDFSKFFSILVEKGYHLHDEKEKISFEKLYDWEIWHLYHLIEELSNISGLGHLKPLFYLQNECVNLKLIGKRLLFGQNEANQISVDDLNDLPLTSYTIHSKSEILSFFKDFLVSTDFLEKYLHDEIFYEVAKDLIKPTKESGKENLSGSKLDILIDQFYFSYVNKIVQRCDSEFLIFFYDIFSALTNIKNILRLFFEKKQYFDFEPFYIESSYITREICKTLFETKFEKVSSILIDIENPLSSQISEIISTVLKDKDLSMVEKWIDDVMTDILKENMRTAFFNFENLIAFKWAKEIELKNIKIIYIGKKNNLPREMIEKLIRKSYVS